jgi:hypothetical protein
MRSKLGLFGSGIWQLWWRLVVRIVIEWAVEGRHAFPFLICRHEAPIFGRQLDHLHAKGGP